MVFVCKAEHAQVRNLIERQETSSGERDMGVNAQACELGGCEGEKRVLLCVWLVFYLSSLFSESTISRKKPLKELVYWSWPREWLSLRGGLFMCHL